MKLPNFEDWSNGELSKSTKIWLSKSIFYVKNHRNLSQFFFHWRISIKEHIWCYWHFLIKSIFKAVYYQNDAQFLTPRHYSNSQNLVISFEYSWFLAKNLSNFVPLPWKLHNQYCHTAWWQYMVTAWQLPQWLN